MNRFNKIFFGGFLVVLFVMFIQFGNVQAEVYPSKGNTIVLPKEMSDSKKTKDEQHTTILLTNENFLLEGLIDHVQFYYEVPVEGLKKDNYLYLNLQYSNLLLQGSTITVSIDGEPVQSYELLPNKTAMEMKVPLTGNAIKRGIHHLSISFYGHLAENICANEENPANWLTILSDSYISLQTDGLIELRENVLEDYPYPFIQNQQDDPVQSMIVIPNDVSENELTATLHLASYLSSLTANKAEIKVVQEADVKKITTHMIAVGAIDQWKGIIKDLFASSGEPVNEGEMVIRNRFMQFPQMTKQIMFITATDDQKILESISLLTKDDYIKQLTRNDIAIQTLPHLEKEEIRETVLFEDLNIPSLTLSGIQTMTQHYFYHIPTYVDIDEDAYLHLKLKVSETLIDQDEALDEKSSELVVYVNDTPHSIPLNSLEEEVDGFYNVVLPIHPTHLQKERYVTLQFQGHGLREKEICVPPTDEKWIYIHEESYLQVPLRKENNNSTSFQSWPAPFVADEKSETTILLLDELTETTIRELQYVTNSLASYGAIEGLHVINQDVALDYLAEQHVIMLGTLAQWEYLDEYKDQLFIKTDDEGSLLVNEFGFLTETATKVGFIQPSLWNENKLMAVFSSVHKDGESFLSKELIDYIHSHKTHANIIIESENGEVFTNKLAEEEESKPLADADKEMNEGWVIYTFVGIVVLSIVIFTIAFRKTKKRKE